MSELWNNDNIWAKKSVSLFANIMDVIFNIRETQLKFRNLKFSNSVKIGYKVIDTAFDRGIDTDLNNSDVIETKSIDLDMEVIYDKVNPFYENLYSNDNLIISNISDHITLDIIGEFYIIGYIEAKINKGEWSRSFKGIKAYLESGCPGYNIEKLLAKNGFGNLPSTPGRAPPSGGKQFEQDKVAYEQHAYRTSILNSIILDDLRSIDKSGSTESVILSSEGYQDCNLLELITKIKTERRLPTKEEHKQFKQGFVIEDMFDIYGTEF